VFGQLPTIRYECSVILPDLNLYLDKLKLDRFSGFFLRNHSLNFFQLERRPYERFKNKHLGGSDC